MDPKTLRMFALASQLGFSLAAPLVFFIGGGILLDRKVGTTPLFLLVGVILGMIGAGYGLWDVVKRFPTEQIRRRPPSKRPE